jgi:hypothetical protein
VFGFASLAWIANVREIKINHKWSVTGAGNKVKNEFPSTVQNACHAFF